MDTHFHNSRDLRLLLAKAYVYDLVLQTKKKRSKKYVSIEYFYRDKDLRYYQMATTSGVMQTYIKDNNGDPRSPINERLHGLHFSVNIEFSTGKPMHYSVYGNTRLCIPAEAMMDACPNVYFADFFCLKKGVHHVTLVLTRPDSVSDCFCKKHLILLDPESNPFLRRRENSDGQRCVEVLNNGIWIEVFFTEDIDMRAALGSSVGGKLLRVQQRGKRTGPRPKDITCRFCNV
jgi:hypothetical protein